MVIEQFSGYVMTYLVFRLVANMFAFGNMVISATRYKTSLCSLKCKWTAVKLKKSLVVRGVKEGEDEERQKLKVKQELTSDSEA